MLKRILIKEIAFIKTEHQYNFDLLCMEHATYPYKERKRQKAKCVSYFRIRKIKSWSKLLSRYSTDLNFRDNHQFTVRVILKPVKHT